MLFRLHFGENQILTYPSFKLGAYTSMVTEGFCFLNYVFFLEKNEMIEILLIRRFLDVYCYGSVVFDAVNRFQKWSRVSDGIFAIVGFTVITYKLIHRVIVYGSEYFSLFCFCATLITLYLCVSRSSKPAHFYFTRSTVLTLTITYKTVKTSNCITLSFYTVAFIITIKTEPFTIVTLFVYLLNNRQLI